MSPSSGSSIPERPGDGDRPARDATRVLGRFGIALTERRQQARRALPRTPPLEVGEHLAHPPGPSADLAIDSSRSSCARNAE